LEEAADFSRDIKTFYLTNENLLNVKDLGMFYFKNKNNLTKMKLTILFIGGMFNFIKKITI
jgi:hypothetical protein